MNMRVWMLGAALGCALLVPAVLAADELNQEVRGRLVAVDASNGARGDFRITSQRATHGVRETISMRASRLGARPDESGKPPEYRAVLVDADGGSADFGAVRLDRDGHASLRFDSRRDEFPSGVTTVTAFGGGTFELRLAGAAVLRGGIPRFVAIGDTGTKDARAFFHGDSRLSATLNGGSGRGEIDARAWSGTKRGEQRLRIGVQQVGRLGSPFAVVAIDGGGVETTLGSITTRGASGEGSLVFDGRKGDPIPGGGILGLSGERIEVRNSAGTAVLTGTFPVVP